MPTERTQTLRENWLPILQASAVVVGIVVALSLLDVWIHQIPSDWVLRYTLSYWAGAALAGLTLFPLRKHRRPLVCIGVFLWFLAPFLSGTLQGKYLRTHPKAQWNTPYLLTVSKVADGFSVVTMILVCGVPLEVYLTRKAEGWLRRKREEDPSFRPIP
jgi:hypothetical protein